MFVNSYFYIATVMVNNGEYYHTVLPVTTGIIVLSEGLTLNGPLYSTVIGTLVVGGWAVTFGTARRGLGGLRPRPVPSSPYQM